MQLFGLVNSMLGAERSTAERDLSIARYAVIPLSPNSGLIGWVPNCDTLHALIRYPSKDLHSMDADGLGAMMASSDSAVLICLQSGPQLLSRPPNK